MKRRIEWFKQLAQEALNGTELQRQLAVSVMFEELKRFDHQDNLRFQQAERREFFVVPPVPDER